MYVTYVFALKQYKKAKSIPRNKHFMSQWL